MNYKELARAVMEAEVWHRLLAANGKPKKAGCVIQSEFEGLRTRSAKSRKRACPS